jgi:hypothetical protein
MKALCRAVIALVACLLGAGAAAQTIYRCGNEYTRVPCAGGKVVNAESRVTEAQRAEARRVASQERKLADAMARERRADAAGLHPSGAASPSPVKAPAPAPAASATAKKKKSQAKKKPVAADAGEDFLARVPKAKPATP